MVTTKRTDSRTMTVVASNRPRGNARILTSDDPTQLESRTSTSSNSRTTVTGGRGLGQRSAPREAKQAQVLQELLLACRERFVRVAYNILQNREDAEDAVQDAFLSACRHFGAFEGRAAVTTWLTRIVINAALMMRRRRKNTVLRSFQDLGANDGVLIETMPDVRPGPESAYSQTESFEFLDALLAKMNPLHRKAVTMAYYSELSALEASSALAIPITTYKARLLRGRRFLQESARRQRRRMITVS
jgi:RNA polymerase sigma-70 factor, ECF subfamily